MAVEKLGINLPLFIAQLVNVVLLIWILRAFLDVYKRQILGLLIAWDGRQLVCLLGRMYTGFRWLCNSWGQPGVRPCSYV